MVKLEQSSGYSTYPDVPVLLLNQHNMSTSNSKRKYEILASVIHVVVLQRTAEKCTKISDARAQPLFCSLKLSCFSVLVAVVVVVCSRSLLIWLERCSVCFIVCLILYPCVDCSREIPFEYL